jgi:hypothetical protein
VVRTRGLSVDQSKGGTVTTVYVAVVERGQSATYATADDVTEIVGVFWTASAAAKALEPMQIPENMTWVEDHAIQD